MNPLFKYARELLPALLLLILPPPVSVQAAELSSESIYRLAVTLVDQDGREFRFADRRGRPQLVSMFYTSCQYTCPLIIDTLKKTQRALTSTNSPPLQILLVSLDPERDTSARLKQVYAERKLDSASWTLARTDTSDVRKLAAVLDIQYRVLANHDINHSTALVLLDADGRVAARTDEIGSVDPSFVAAVRKVLVPQMIQKGSR
jgi:protein SCO1/2